MRTARIADRPDDAGAQIVEPADVVDDRERRDVVRERVDREIAAERIFLGRSERVVVVNQVRALGRRRIRRRHAVLHDLFTGRELAAKCRDFDHLGAELHVRETKSAADDPAVPKEFLDLIRMGRRADVEILGVASEQQVANAAADEIGDVVGLPKAIQHLEGIGVDVAARDGVIGSRNDPRFGHCRALYQQCDVRLSTHTASSS